MAKITDYPDGLTPQPGDYLILARSPYGSGSNYKLLASTIMTIGLTPNGILYGAADGTVTQSAGLTYDSSTGVLTVNNKSLTLGGNLTTSGAFNATFTLTNTTNVTLPTSGTLLTSATAVTSITGTSNQVIASASVGAVTLSLPQSIATSSNVQFGTVGVGTTAIYTIHGFSTNNVTQLLRNPTGVGVDGGTSGVLFSIADSSVTNDTYAKAAVLFEKVNADGSARGKLHLCLNSTADSSNASKTNALLTLYSGRVGIGATSPSSNAKLHVQVASSGLSSLGASTLILESNTNQYLSILSGGEAGLIFANSSNTADGGIIYDNASAVRGFQFRTGGNTTRMVIDSGGITGINTATPSNYRGKFVITDGAEGGMSIISSATTQRGVIYFGDGTDATSNSRGQVSYYHNTDALIFTASNADIAYINSSGLGVGTTAAGVYKFKLYRNDNAHNYLRIENGNGAYQSALDFLTPNGEWVVFMPSNTGNLSFYVAGQSSDTVTMSGLFMGVGITPTCPLQVNSTFTSTGAVTVAALNVTSATGASSGTLSQISSIMATCNCSANAATVTTYAAFSVLPGSGSGTITSAFGMVTSKPGFGTSQYSFYSASGAGVNNFNTGATHAFNVGGSAGLTTGTLWTNISDDRLKQNISDVEEDILTQFENLHLKKYKYIPEYCADSDMDAEKEHYGYLASEIEAIEPKCIVIEADRKIYNGSMKRNLETSQRNAYKKQTYDNAVSAKEQTLTARAKYIEDNPAAKPAELDDRFKIVEPVEPVYEEEVVVESLPIENIKGVDYHPMLMKSFAAIGELSKQVKVLTAQLNSLMGI